MDTGYVQGVAAASIFTSLVSSERSQSFAKLQTIRGQGGVMKLAISYRHVEFLEPVQKAVNNHLKKIGRLLCTYAPDLVQLRGHFEKHAVRTEFTCSVNLSLPTGTLHASAAAGDA